jgi:hypothetical protein
MLEQILESGYRAVARKVHPDNRRIHRADAKTKRNDDHASRHPEVRDGKKDELSSPLNCTDLQGFYRVAISEEMVNRAKIVRVNSQEALEDFGINLDGDGGILFRYFPRGSTTDPHFYARIRRDNPPLDASGKRFRKYVCPFGEQRHLYIPPFKRELLSDPKSIVIFVEAEKSALAITEWSERNSVPLIAIATGGCWGFRGTIGKIVSINGARKDEKGPLEELDLAKGRRAYICLDANVETNKNVAAARKNFIAVLQKIAVEVWTMAMPTGSQAINGPDDLLGSCDGDAKFKAILDAAVRQESGKTKRSTTSVDGSAVPKEKKKPSAFLLNAVQAIATSSEWDGVVGFNKFSMRIVFQKSPPFIDHVAPGAEWDDHADRLLTLWLQEKGVLVGKSIAADAIEVIARSNSFHPIADYLNGLRWDGTSRLDLWLPNYLGAPDSPYTRAVGPRWMISGVARIFVAGAKVDSVLILKGPQGKRKSMALAELAGPEFFSDHISALGSKDSLQELLGIWIVEMAELASLRRSGLDQMKAFLTTRIDHFRPSYGRRVMNVPRSNIFAGSVNDTNFLEDETGARRFWPVPCGEIDIPALKRDRDQLWAEAVRRYRDHEPWWIDSDELSAVVEDVQEDHYVPGIWDELILPWIEEPTQRLETSRDGNATLVEPFTSTPSRTTILEVLIHAVGKEKDRITDADRKGVVRCLKHAKWISKRNGKSRWYERPGMAAKDDSISVTESSSAKSLAVF